MIERWRRPGPLSTIRPAYMTATRSQVSATTPRSCVTRIIAMPSSSTRREEQLQDLILDRDVEGRRRLVGQKQLRLRRQRDGDHRALAHPAREFVRIVSESRRRRRNADEVQKLDRPPAPRRAAKRRVRDERFVDLQPDGQHGIQRRHRLLEDHGDLGAAHRVEAASRAARSRSSPRQSTWPLDTRVRSAGCGRSTGA